MPFTTSGVASNPRMGGRGGNKIDDIKRQLTQTGLRTIAFDWRTTRDIWDAVSKVNQVKWEDPSGVL
jgi:hypothetical protein